MLALMPGRSDEALTAGRNAIEAARKNGEHLVMAMVAYHDLAYEHGTADQDNSAFRNTTAAGLAEHYHWSEHAAHLAARDEFEPAAQAYMAAYALDGPIYTICRAGANLYLADRRDDALGASRLCIERYAVAASVDTTQLAAAHRLAGLILTDRGVYSSGEQHARQALALEPDNFTAAHILARALIGDQRPSEAAAAAEQAIRLSDGRDGSAHFVAGSAYFELKQWARCESSFRRAFEINPKEANAAYNAALCLARQGYHSDGARWLEKALESNPNHPDRRDIEAQIRLWRNR